MGRGGRGGEGSRLPRISRRSRSAVGRPAPRPGTSGLGGAVAGRGAQKGSAVEAGLEAKLAPGRGGAKPRMQGRPGSRRATHAGERGCRSDPPWRMIDAAMDGQAQKEHFSQAVLKGLASVAGIGMAQPSPDDQSVDWNLRGEDIPGAALRYPQLDVQLKCTATLDRERPLMSFQLKRKNYVELQGGGFAVPRVLVVVHVPNDVGEWLRGDRRRTLLKHCAYWLSLRTYPPIGTTQQTRVVHIPQANLLTPYTLRSLLAVVANGGAP
jgi:Domain of unknown function (DUF4365)